MIALEKKNVNSRVLNFVKIENLLKFKHTKTTRSKVNAYSIVGKARRAHLSTSQHIKPEPSGEALMW